MSSANQRQVGGDHYNSKYQHWDFVNDISLHYYLGCATKYISRHKKKNGVEDLKKSIHYIEKAKENKIQTYVTQCREDPLKKFVENTITLFNISNGLGEIESLIMHDIIAGRYDSAVLRIKGLIDGE